MSSRDLSITITNSVNVFVCVIYFPADSQVNCGIYNIGKLSNFTSNDVGGHNATHLTENRMLDTMLLVSWE